jgi:putative Mn2+ efflux pump MntP
MLSELRLDQAKARVLRIWGTAEGRMVLHGVGALLLLAVALGSDAFSVAVCVGLEGATWRQKLRLAAGFGVFQFLMPIIGLALGSTFGGMAGAVSSYIGGGILAALGVGVIWRTLAVGIHCPPLLLQSFVALVMASLGVSLDALAVGVGYGLGVREVRIVLASVVIGAVAYLMTIAGAELGGQVGKAVHQRAPLVGGAILIGLGIRILVGG